MFYQEELIKLCFFIMLAHQLHILALLLIPFKRMILIMHLTVSLVYINLTTIISFGDKYAS